MKVEEIKPYGSSGEKDSMPDKGNRPGKLDTSEDKSSQVERMFDSISPRYDFMNAAMSLFQHKLWRNKALRAAINALTSLAHIKVLDVAAGTGDVAFRLHSLLSTAQITGLDLSEGMLAIAAKKLADLPAHERKQFDFVKGDSLAMPFHDKEFDLITVAYGVRNFSDLKKGLQEMKRVLKPGGVACIIELSTPTGRLPRYLYDIYAGKIIPRMGRIITGDEAAYSYLPESIAACPQREDMAALLYEAGFKNVEWRSLSFGALTYYICT